MLVSQREADGILHEDFEVFLERTLDCPLFSAEDLFSNPAETALDLLGFGTG